VNLSTPIRGFSSALAAEPFKKLAVTTSARLKTKMLRYFFMKASCIHSSLF
jgi:hypothetical protein